MQKTVRMGDTDATGLIYFTALQRMAIEVLEGFLENTPYAIHELLTKGAFLFPIVHVEANYLAPILLGDILDVSLQLQKAGTSSFELYYLFHKEKKIVANVKIVHVTVSKVVQKPLPTPQDFIDLFN